MEQFGEHIQPRMKSRAEALDRLIVQPSAPRKPCQPLRLAERHMPAFLTASYSHLRMKSTRLVAGRPSETVARCKAGTIMTEARRNERFWLKRDARLLKSGAAVAGVAAGSGRESSGFPHNLGPRTSRT